MESVKVGKISVFSNSDVTIDNIDFFRTIDENYTPLQQYQTNKTVVCETSKKKALFQLVIYKNRADIFVPSDSIDFFKTKVVKDLVSYLSDTFKLQSRSSDVNKEIEFSLSIYIDSTSTAVEGWMDSGAGSNVMKKWGWLQSTVVKTTSLGVKLSVPCVKFIMLFKFDKR